MSEKMHIIFDFNGVIIADEKIHFLATQAALKKVLNQQISEELYLKYFMGRTNEAAFLHYFKDTDIVYSIDEICKIKSIIYMELVQKEDLSVPSTINFIKEFKHLFTYSVVSGARKSEILFHLQKLGIENLFSSILSSEDITESKPSPQGFLKAIALSKIPTEHTYIIEDSLSGVQAAKAANAFCIALTTTHTPEELFHADLVVSDLSINCFKR